MKKAVQTVLVIIVVIAAIVGWKFYNKSQDKTEIKAQLVEVCDKEDACIKAVEEHYSACFDDSYKMGGRREGSSIDGAKLANCINTKAGDNFFAYSEDEGEEG